MAHPNPLGWAYTARNLVGHAVNASTSFSFTADYLVLRNSNDGVIIRKAVSASADIAVAGPAAGGRDQAGAFSAGNAIHVYAIAGDGLSAAGIASLSAPSTGPALPSGYTHWCYLASFILAAGPVFADTYVRGSVAYYGAQQTALASGSATSETEVSVSGLVPAVATAWLAGLLDSFSGGSLQLRFRVTSGADYFGHNVVMDTRCQVWVPNVSQRFFYLIETDPLTVYVMGYQIPNGAD